MRVYILDNGVLKTDKNNVVAGATMCTRTRPFAQHEFYEMPVMSVLIEHDNGYLLFDTGSNMHSMEKGYWDEGIQDIYELKQSLGQNIEIQLATCGVRKEEINTVVLSHMHFDHTGNLKLFKNAKVYAPKADVEFARNAFAKGDSTAAFGYHKPDLELPINYTLVEKDFELFKGVEVICLPGHSPGVLGLVVHTEKSGTLIFPMDAVYTKEIYGPPAKASGLVFNRTEYFASIEKVREIAKKYRAQVIPAHDNEVFKNLKKAPYYYE
ncbi:MAG: N-acyl homoserine lactonase family protein [Clostridia bacterium]|nr:N-acyl homoserine lactonase family protein [Clostridia bacterium]